MHVAGLYLPLVFAAGVASFASPCVLPLVPGYVATVSGVSVDELGSPPAFGRVARSSGWFFAGFLLVFLALGATASVIDGLKSVEFAMRSEGEGPDREKVFLSGSQDLPRGWQALVEEYYRSLSRKPAE